MPSSLADFVASRKPQRDCAVCKGIPPKVAEEILGWWRSQRNVRVGRAGVVREWLKTEHGLDFDEEAFRVHITGRHWSR